MKKVPKKKIPEDGKQKFWSTFFDFFQEKIKTSFLAKIPSVLPLGREIMPLLSLFLNNHGK